VIGCVTFVETTYLSPTLVWNQPTTEQRWADIDILTPDPHGTSEKILWVSNPYPKISEI